MSYDVYLLPPGGDPAAAYERLAESEQPFPSDDEATRWRAVADELCALNPGFERDEGGGDFWSIQLTQPEAEHPVDVDIYADHAVVTFSYGGGAFERKVDEVAQYVDVFERHGLVAFDPQTEKRFDASRDRDEIVRTATWVQDQALGDLADAERRPWWKRLLGR